MGAGGVAMDVVGVAMDVVGVAMDVVGVAMRFGSCGITVAGAAWAPDSPLRSREPGIAQPSEVFDGSPALGA
ncbi:hypothetical protein BJQ89_01374 [Arthrobacter sp. ES1]|nr:hypothetical protein [Arthrobacter sp. ES1]